MVARRRVASAAWRTAQHRWLDINLRTNGLDRLYLAARSPSRTLAPPLGDHVVWRGGWPRFSGHAQQHFAGFSQLQRQRQLGGSYRAADRRLSHAVGHDWRNNYAGGHGGRSVGLASYQQRDQPEQHGDAARVGQSSGGASVADRWFGWRGAVGLCVGVLCVGRTLVWRVVAGHRVVRRHVIHAISRVVCAGDWLAASGRRGITVSFGRHFGVNALDGQAETRRVFYRNRVGFVARDVSATPIFYSDAGIIAGRHRIWFFVFALRRVGFDGGSLYIQRLVVCAAVLGRLGLVFNQRRVGGGRGAVAAGSGVDAALAWHSAGT